MFSSLTVQGCVRLWSVSWSSLHCPTEFWQTCCCWSLQWETLEGMTSWRKGRKEGMQVSFEKSSRKFHWLFYFRKINMVFHSFFLLQSLFFFLFFWLLQYLSSSDFYFFFGSFLVTFKVILKGIGKKKKKKMKLKKCLLTQRQAHDAISHKAVILKKLKIWFNFEYWIESNQRNWKKNSKKFFFFFCFFSFLFSIVWTTSFGSSLCLLSRICILYLHFVSVSVCALIMDATIKNLKLNHTLQLKKYSRTFFSTPCLPLNLIKFLL